VAVNPAKQQYIFGLSSLSTLMRGSAPVDTGIGQALAKRLGCRVVQGYGMTEESPVSHITPFDGGERLVGMTAP
jgi:long-subunit acyl-CoA synthetase (AMP-forming)